MPSQLRATRYVRPARLLLTPTHGHVSQCGTSSMMLNLIQHPMISGVGNTAEGYYGENRETRSYIATSKQHGVPSKSYDGVITKQDAWTKKVSGHPSLNGLIGKKRDGTEAN